MKSERTQPIPEEKPNQIYCPREGLKKQSWNLSADKVLPYPHFADRICFAERIFFTLKVNEKSKREGPVAGNTTLQPIFVCKEKPLLFYLPSSATRTAYYVIALKTVFEHFWPQKNHPFSCDFYAIKRYFYVTHH